MWPFSVVTGPATTAHRRCELATCVEKSSPGKSTCTEPASFWRRERLADVSESEEHYSCLSSESIAHHRSV